MKGKVKIMISGKMKKYDLFITLKNGDVYKTNEVPCPLSDYCDILLPLTDTAIFGDNIEKFEIIESCVNATERQVKS